MEHKRMLFVDQDSTVPLKFFMRPCSEKAKLRPLIEHGGGMMVSRCGPDTIRLVEPGTRVLNCDHNTLSTKYILDCVERNLLLEKSAYRVRIHGVSYSDISEEDSTYKIRTTERNLKSRKEYSTYDDEKILNYIIKTKRYSDVKGNRIWKSMSNSGMMDGRTWQSLKERFLKKIAPKLKKFNLTDNQLRYFSLALGHKVAIPREKCALEEFTEQMTNANDNFTKMEEWGMLRYIFDHFVHENLKSDDMWVRMEKSATTSHSWKDMKEHFFKQIVPNIGKYHLPRMEIKRLSTVIELPTAVLRKYEFCGDECEEEGSSTTQSSSRLEKEQNDSSPFTNGEIQCIVKYIFEHMVDDDISSDTVWKTMESDGVLIHSWKSLKNTFFNNIVPNIYQYNLPKHHVKRLGSMVSLPEAPADYDDVKEEACTDAVDSGSPNSQKENKKSSEVSFSEKESLAILQCILNVLARFEHMDKQPIADFMWRKMEASGVIPYTWLSMKSHFFHHIMPNIEKYNLSNEDKKRLQNLVDLPVRHKDTIQGEGSSASDSEGQQACAPQAQLNSLRLSLGAKLNGSPSKVSSDVEEIVDCLDRELLKNLHLPPLESAEKTISWFLAPEQNREMGKVATGYRDAASCQTTKENSVQATSANIDSSNKGQSDAEIQPSATRHRRTITPPESRIDIIEEPAIQSKRRRVNKAVATSAPKNDVVEIDLEDHTVPSDSEVNAGAQKPVISPECEVAPLDVEEMRLQQPLHGSGSNLDSPVSIQPRRQRQRCAVLSDAVTDNPTSNQENYVPPPKQRRSGLKRTTEATAKRQTLIERNSPPTAHGEDEENRRCISTNSIVLMETATEGVGDIFQEFGELLAVPADDEGARENKLRQLYAKVGHLQKIMTRALLSARVERIMEKSPNYMSFEDKLALYKFVTFCRM